MVLEAMPSVGGNVAARLNYFLQRGLVGRFGGSVVNSIRWWTFEYCQVHHLSLCTQIQDHLLYSNLSSCLPKYFSPVSAETLIFPILMFDLFVGVTPFTEQSEIWQIWTNYGSYTACSWLDVRSRKRLLRTWSATGQFGCISERKRWVSMVGVKEYLEHRFHRDSSV